MGDDVAKAAEPCSLPIIRRACAESAIESNGTPSTHRRNYGTSSSRQTTFEQRLKVSTSAKYSKRIEIIHAISCFSAKP
jgi:hypothetical protein